MHVCHVNLAAELGGGTLQTLALIETLGTRIQQSAVVQRNTPLALALSGFDWLDTRPVANSLAAATRATARAELLHIHEGRSVTVGALRSIVSGTPFLTVRGVAQPPNTSRFSRWRYERAAAVVAISTQIADTMRAYSDRLRVVIIPDCVRPLRANRDRVQRLRGRTSGRLVVGHVGALQDAVKGQSLILEVARALQRSHPHLLFWLIGDGPDGARLRSLARGLANVEFVGWAADVADYYSAMDIFVFPSRKEGLGSSLLEAMSFGVPIIAAQVGGIPDVVQHEENGLLIEADNAGQLRQAVERLAESAELRERLGAVGARRARDYSPQSRAAGYLQLYRNILEGGGNPDSL